MLRSLKSLGGNRVDGATEVGVCLHRAMALAVVPPTGRGAGQAFVLELPIEADEQARSLARAVTDIGVKGCRASVALPLGSYHLIQIERPPVESAELIDAARWRIKGQLDYPVEDATIQVFEVPHGESQRTPLIHVVAAPNRTIRELTSLVKRAGLVPSKVTIVELAVRDLASRVTAQDEPVATVFLSAKQGVIQVSHGGDLYLTRRVDYGLANAMPADAMATGIHLTLPLELRRTVDYFESQFGLGTVRRVLAAPTDAPFMKFMKDTSEFTRIPVEPLELPLPVQLAQGKAPDFGLSEAYLAASVALGRRGLAAEGSAA